MCLYCLCCTNSLLGEGLYVHVCLVCFCIITLSFFYNWLQFLLSLFSDFFLIFPHYLFSFNTKFASFFYLLKLFLFSFFCGFYTLSFKIISQLFFSIFSLFLFLQLLTAKHTFLSFFLLSNFHWAFFR